MSKKPLKQSKPSKQSDDFVPDDSVSEGASGYMKFEAGTNQFRAISNPITGWVVWEGDEDDRKPVRTPLEDGEPDAPSKDPMDKAKKFLAFVVIDRADDGVKILEITQQSVIKGIRAYSANPKWGKPFSYDINVEKKGESKKTRYTITAEPKEALSKDLIAAAQERPCNLDALFAGENPWEEDQDEYTEYHFK